jgi:hypothetical protein
VLDQRKVMADISADIRGGGFGGALDELSDVCIGVVRLPHVPASFHRWSGPGTGQQEPVEVAWRRRVPDMEPRVPQVKMFDHFFFDFKFDTLPRADWRVRIPVS